MDDDHRKSYRHFLPFFQIFFRFFPLSPVLKNHKDLKKKNHHQTSVGFGFCFLFNYEKVVILNS